MTEGYVSDATIDEDVIVMDEPFCTITIDLDQLSVPQAMQVGIQLGAVDNSKQMEVNSYLQNGGGERPEFGTVELHLDAGHALTLLNQHDFVDLGGEEEIVEE